MINRPYNIQKSLRDKLALFGFVFLPAKCSNFLILCCYQRAYVNLGPTQIGFVLHFFAPGRYGHGQPRILPGANILLFPHFLLRYSLFDIRDSIRYVLYPKSALMQSKSPFLGKKCP